MFEIHPTETAGDGKKFFRRTTPQKGDPTEDRTRCAMCGFPFRTGVDAEGDTQDSPGISIADEVIPVSNDQKKLPQHLQGLSMFAVTSKTTSVPTITSGCRLCGTYNPKGKQSKEFDNLNKDMSNQ